jgi:hypothetical protein
MLQPGGAGGLAAEALHELLVLGEAPVQELERHLPAELEILGAVDVRHAPGAHALQDPVALIDDGVPGDGHCPYCPSA